MFGVYGVTFVLYILMLIWFAAGSLFVGGRARRFHSVNGLQIAETPKIVNYLLLAVFLISLVACLLKPDFLPDYRMYEYWFEKNFAKDEIEPTFLWIMSVSPTYLILVGIFAVLSIGLNLLAIKYISPNIWISLLTYFSLWFVLHDIIQIRVAVASGFALLSLIFLQSRRPLYFILLMICAVLFHYSSILFALFWFFSVKRPFKIFYYFLIAISFILFLSNEAIGHLASYIPVDIVQAYVEVYANSTEHALGGIGVVWVVRLLMGVVMIARIDKIKERYPYAIIVVKIYVFSMLSYILFRDIPVMAGRVSELLGVITIYAFAMFPLVLPKLRQLWTLIIVIMLCYSSKNAISILSIPNYIDKIDSMGESRR